MPALPRRRHHLAAVVLCVLLLLIGLPTAVLAWALYDVGVPSVAAMTSQRSIVLQAADGTTLPHEGAFSLPTVPVHDMPADVVNAVLSIEDRYFYAHGPIDVPSMVRAFMQNSHAGRIVAGGSTITQQLVKLRYVGPQRTYRRKIQEAAVAFWLEHQSSKDQILTSYLNNVYLGSGATGFPAAAQLYFGKTVGELSLPEAAMLAGMINAPSQDDPLNNLNAARNRAATVLDAMVTNGKLSAQAALVAKLHPATPHPTQPGPASASWFADWVYDKVATAATTGGAIRVRTTLDLQLQNLASNVVNSVLAEYGAQKNATQAALVAMRPDGAVVAMVGGRSYTASQFNRAVQAKRQPGSAFKLFDYYAALRQGFRPGDEILDEPVDIEGWEPRNFGRRYHGEVTLADAFAHSLNAATVRLSQQVGIGNVIGAARELGLHSPLPNEPSIALGASDVTLIDLTSAYAAIQAGVSPVEPWGIAGVQTPDHNGFEPIGRPDEPQRSLGQYQGEMIDLLRGVVEHGTGREAALPGAAGKTGTTQDYRDAWFIGFDNSIIVGVWVGNDDHSPMRDVVGGSLPATIWKQFMQQAQPVVAQEPQPSPAAPAASVSAGEQTQPAEQPPPVAQQQQPPVALQQQPPPVAQQPQPPVAQPQQPAAAEPAARAPAPEQTQQPPRPKVATQQQQPDTAAETARAPAREQTQPSLYDKAVTSTNTDTSGAKCDIARCQQSYQSFRASDCTYQPYDGGPRRACGRQAEMTNSGESGRRAETPSPPRRTSSRDRYSGRYSDRYSDRSADRSPDRPDRSPDRSDRTDRSAEESPDQSAEPPDPPRGMFGGPFQLFQPNW